MNQMVVQLSVSDLRDMVSELLKNELLKLQNIVIGKPEKQFYTFKEVLERFSVTRPTVNKWMKSGLNCYRKGSRVFFDVSEVEQFIKN